MILSGNNCCPFAAEKNFLTESFEHILPVLIPFIADVDAICALASLDAQLRNSIIAYFGSEARQPVILIRNDTVRNIANDPVARCILRNARHLALSAPDTEFVCCIPPYRVFYHLVV